MSSNAESPIIHLSSRKFILFCLLASVGLLILGRFINIPPWVIAVEVFVTVITLFILGSIRYRLDKNALTYGAALIIVATFWNQWWEGSQLRVDYILNGWPIIFDFFHHHFLTLHGLDAIFHADTMLFILGLTFFVGVIAQTRMLETASFSVLEKTKGAVVPTIAILAALVAVLSGILDGVSMIGLMIRILVIILFLAKAKDDAVVYAVIVSTVVTTVCGMWLAYGEPPNLIMKSNLHPHLDNAFFLRFCAPVAVGSYFIVYWNIRKRLKGSHINTKTLDVLDRNTADIRFLQASRHGEVLTPIEFVEEHQEQLGDHFEPVINRLHHGEPLGHALVKEDVAPAIRRAMMGKFVSENLSEVLDKHYAGHSEAADHKIALALDHVRTQRIRAQIIGGLSFIPFIGLLIAHAINHDIPLFYASFAGFVVAFSGIYSVPKVKKLALKEARHEYSEYLFLFPLFLSITLLQKTGFFGLLSELLHAGLDKIGPAHMAYLQFTGCTFLSAMLDNNVVADFAGRAIQGLEVSVIHLFAMSQIAGYAVGGCWTHIGSAQSVVAYSFIQKEVNNRFTPYQWMRAMTPVILEIFILMTLVIYGESWLFHIATK
ncbi:MAG: hypothetical protein KCHDKBKB_02329 [Elusimicrobia bacterium]|nr:hypothetical protein [Elusimicrobiota bacterium]